MVTCPEHTERWRESGRNLRPFLQHHINKLRSLLRKSKATRMPLLWPAVTTEATRRVDTLTLLWGSKD